MKTSWPEMVETTTNTHRETLIDLAKSLPPTNGRTVTLHFSGIECTIPREKSASILESDLTRENEEYLRLAKKYRSLGLQYEGILKTKFFNRLIRKINVLKDFFFFTEFDEDGMTWANLKKLRESPLGDVFKKIADDISDLRCDCVNSIDARIDEITAIDHEMKNLLWPKHADSMITASKRKIKIELPGAPGTVRDRLVCWREKGFNPHLMAHVDAISPDVPAYAKLVIDALNYKINQLEYQSLSAVNLRKLRQHLESTFSTRTLHGDKKENKDPMLYLYDGDWTVIVDQYGDFAKEKEIVATVKEHYNFLGRKYGILTNN